MKYLFKIICVVLLIGGCNTSEQNAFKSPLLDRNGNFTLSVSNQSFKINPVDICIKIDGILVVDDLYDVGKQHNYKSYVLKLDKGKHHISISSGKGRASLEQEFNIIDKHWSYAWYGYNPEQKGSDSGRKMFYFIIHDKDIGID